MNGRIPTSTTGRIINQLRHDRRIDRYADRRTGSVVDVVVLHVQADTPIVFGPDY